MTQNDISAGNDGSSAGEKTSLKPAIAIEAPNENMAATIAVDGTSIVGNSNSKIETAIVATGTGSGSGTGNNSSDGTRRDSVGSNISTATEGRRRSKVSRACDQCRKKKIKCDYQEDTSSDQSCTGCRKIGEKCSFERVPLKRGPSKGYTRSNSQSRERRSSQHRSSGNSQAATIGTSTNDNAQRKKESAVGLSVDAKQEAREVSALGQPAGTASNVALPPLLQYLPGMNSTTPAPASVQQPFWKVPYHEYQYQRRPSLDSMTSDTSQKVSGQQAQTQLQVSQQIGAGSNKGPIPIQDPFRGGQRFYYPSQEQSGSDVASEDRRASSAIPPLLNPNLSAQQQYSYSQFALAQQQQFQQNQHLPKQATPNIGGFSNNTKGTTNTTGHVLERTESVASDASSFNVSPNVFNAEMESSPSSPAQKKRKRSTRSNSSKKSKTGPTSLPLAHSTIINYGQISDVQLIDTYYEFIHLRFPIIPINKETLTNDILIINTQSLSEIHELNNYILHWFRNSLELLIRVCLKDQEAVEPLYQQSIFVNAINECFQKIVDIHPRFRDLENQINEKVATTYLVTFIILNYTLALVSYDNSFVLGMSVIIFNELKLWRKFIFSDWEDISKYEKICLRLYYELSVFDSLQSCCFGAPKLMDLQMHENIVNQLFYDDVAESKDEEVLKWCVDQDLKRLAIIVENMELGLFLTRLCQSKRSSLHLPLPESTVIQDTKSIPKLFQSFLTLKKQFVDLLLELPDSNGKLPEMEPVLVTKLSNMVCQLTSTIHDLLKLNLEVNPTNCVEIFVKSAQSAQTSEASATDQNSLEKGTISPFIIAMFKDLFNVVELIKNMPTSLIGCVMGTQSPDFKSQPLVLQLSQCMNNMLQITSFTSTLRPFKIFKYELFAQSKKQPSDVSPLWKNKMKSSLPPLQKPITPQEIMITQFIDIAWCLADTEELGWFHI